MTMGTHKRTKQIGTAKRAEALRDMLRLLGWLDTSLPSVREIRWRWNNADRDAVEKWVAREAAIANDHPGPRLPVPAALSRLK